MAAHARTRAGAWPCTKCRDLTRTWPQSCGLSVPAVGASAPSASPKRRRFASGWRPLTLGRAPVPLRAVLACAAGPTTSPTRPSSSASAIPATPVRGGPSLPESGEAGVEKKRGSARRGPGMSPAEIPSDCPVPGTARRRGRFFVHAVGGDGQAPGAPMTRAELPGQAPRGTREGCRGRQGCQGRTD